MSKKSETSEFPDKKLKKLPTGFKEDADSLDSAALKKEVVNSSHNIRVIQAERDNDEKLAAAKEEVKLLASAYREAETAQDAKRDYCLFLLEQRGEKMDDIAALLTK
jgi:hypothetical protein